MEGAPKKVKFQESEEPTLSRRNFLALSAAALGSAAANPLLAENNQERIDEGWLEKITSDNTDFSFEFVKQGSDQVVESVHKEALVVIDWQEQYLNSESNPHPAVQKQLQDTEQAILQQIAAAIEQERPVVLVGTAGLSGDPEELMTSGGELADFSFMSPKYPSAVLELLSDYKQVHFVLKDTNSVADARSDSRAQIENILADVNQVRVVGINEAVCGWRSVNDMAKSDFLGEGIKIVINPSELADSQSILESDLESREMYTDLPKNMVFRKVLEMILSDTEGVQDVAVRVHIKHLSGEEETRMVSYVDIKEDMDIFLENNVLPPYFK